MKIGGGGSSGKRNQRKITASAIMAAKSGMAALPVKRNNIKK